MQGTRLFNLDKEDRGEVGEMLEILGKDDNSHVRSGLEL